MPGQIKARLKNKQTCTHSRTAAHPRNLWRLDACVAMSRAPSATGRFPVMRLLTIASAPVALAAASLARTLSSRALNLLLLPCDVPVVTWDGLPVTAPLPLQSHLGSGTGGGNATRVTGCLPAINLLSWLDKPPPRPLPWNKPRHGLASPLAMVSANEPQRMHHVTSPLLTRTWPPASA